MCGRYVLKREDLEAMVKEFGLRSLEDFHSRFNIAPTSVVPLIRAQKSGQPELAAVRWGLIPAWAMPDAPVKPIVNLRSDTLVTRFRGALKSRRCILPASGFYEWQPTGTRKQPWFFRQKDGRPFGLAGIWDTWRGGDGIELETCTVITTAPNALIDPIHTRMPVMLTLEQCHAWLQPSSLEPAALEQFLGSAPAKTMTALKVGPAVSSARNDGPECLAAATEADPVDAGPQLPLGF